MHCDELIGREKKERREEVLTAEEMSAPRGSGIAEHLVAGPWRLHDSVSALRTPRRHLLDGKPAREVLLTNLHIPTLFLPHGHLLACSRCVGGREVAFGAKGIATFPTGDGRAASRRQANHRLAS